MQWTRATFQMLICIDSLTPKIVNRVTKPGIRKQSENRIILYIACKYTGI